MSKFKLHDMTTAPAESRPVLESVQKKFGFVPNLMKIFAESPVALQSYLAVSSFLDNSVLNAAERQIVLLSISFANRCEYCVAVHSMIATKMAGVAPDLVDQLRKGQPLSDKKLNSLATFTQIMVNERGHVSESTLTDFLGVGYTQRHALEVITAIGMKTISNYTNHLAHTPLDPEFQPFEWKAQ